MVVNGYTDYCRDQICDIIQEKTTFTNTRDLMLFALALLNECTSAEARFEC